MSKDIKLMPAEVQPRFKALKVLYDQVMAFDEEEEKEYRELELKYEALYAQTYAKRSDLLNGAPTIDDKLIAAFDERRTELTDAAYSELEVEICSVQEIQNSESGVAGFWLRSMLSCGAIADTIKEKDRAILNYLQDIKLSLHTVGYGFDLTFCFESNSYFVGTELKKEFHMSRQNVIEKCIGTTIEWAAGSDPTHQKKKKKKKVQGKYKNISVNVKTDSFFNFFETVEAKEVEGTKSEEEDEEEA